MRHIHRLFDQVKQMFLLAPLEKHFSVLYGILTDHISENVDYKVLVFCTTAMVTKLVADPLSELNLNVREIHSRKPQSYCTQVSEEFRKSKGLILVTSDVSARGVDYPDVTLVIQVGVPSDGEQYIHRLGRTGRKGKEGKGLLLLAPWEEFFLACVKDLPISKTSLPLVDGDTRKKTFGCYGEGPFSSQRHRNWTKNGRTVDCLFREHKLDRLRLPIDSPVASNVMISGAARILKISKCFSCIISAFFFFIIIIFLHATQS